MFFKSKPKYYIPDKHVEDFLLMYDNRSNTKLDNYELWKFIFTIIPEKLDTKKRWVIDLTNPIHPCIFEYKHDLI